MGVPTAPAPSRDATVTDTAEGLPQAVRLPLVVLIPTHRRVDLLERTLDSVLACTPPASRTVRVIVIENGGRFGAAALVQRKSSWCTPEYRYFEAGNKSAALNSVIDTLGAALLVFLDDDVRVAPALLAAYDAAAGERTGGGIYGGGVLVDYEREPPRWLLPFLPLSATGWRPDSDCASTMPYFFGANWAAFSADIRRAGGFDPRVGPGGHSDGVGQETRMQRALVAAGATRHYLRDALVWHYVPASRCSPRWTLRRQYRQGITLGLKYQPTPRPRQLFGVPLWMIRVCVGKSLAALAASLSLDPATRFRHRYELCGELGRAKGMRRRGPA